MARERVRWPVVVDRAREIVDGYAPLKVTLRQVMYRLVSEGVLPHTPPMYRRLSAQLAQARREGRFPDLIDTVCEVHVPPAWPDAGEFVRQMPDWFRLDRTEGQERALYVAAEKDTLRQQLTGWLDEAGIPVLVVRGFGSQSYADVVRDRVAAEPREADLLVVGDFDCSGEDIERDWVARTGCWSHTERVLLAYEQVRAYELPATEGKRGDPRWPAFARRYGFDPRYPVQWEVEALDPAELRRLVLAAVAPYVDRDVLARLVAREEAQRRALTAFLEGWDAAGGGGPS
ncbi:hypothetical protein [Streptomyces spectabilis]|uniref:Uncharacterized protein n=1 Tax=Streptomyces spectabilis TaxID=68270 RepID=A0A7W8EXJ6_STRST|nr:hypothetical protein [Streptomyces spectabilis]MBB5109137.1 hypothetical protein [Streptomyces spectabilis]MCI3907694.1 hypothetical protein [Streptomyces spectabilis]GGV51065.1 hypothetical protein GCM10010245_80280 [Streptomyces spectabilis]